MKNILLIVPTLYQGGGTEKVLVNLANNLAFDYNILILARRMDNKFNYDINPECKILSSCQLFNKLVFLNRIIFLFHILIINIRFNIFKNISFTNSITLDLGRVIPKKTIAFEHWPLTKYKSNPILTKKIKKVYSRINSIVVLNQNELMKYNQLLENNKKSIHVIYNSTSPIYVKSKKENLVLSIAHFNDQKRNDLLIKSWADVVKKVKDWKLLIIGHGPNLEKCLKIIKEHNLENHIEIVSKTNKVQEYYSKSKIFVLCSNYEALPMVLIEAKSYGLPCLSFDVESGPSEIIKDHVDGFLIKYRDVDSLTEKIISLILNKNKILEMSKMSIIDYEKRFSPETVYKKWREILT